MNRKLFNILLIAFVVAALSSYVVYRVVGNRLIASRRQTTRVLAAAAELKVGTLLRDSDLTTLEIAGPAPQGALLNRTDALGRGVIATIYRGEPIVENQLAAPGSGGGLAATIPPGMRACAVKVDDVVGVAGFATPGMRVDVLVSGNPAGNVGTDQKVRTLLENLEVLSAGTDIQRDNQGKPQPVQVVNLLVTPEQAELLSLAGNQTHIQLVLRNPLDTQIAKTSGSDMTQLFGETPAKATVVVQKRAAPKPAPQGYMVEVLNGSKRSEVQIAGGEVKQ
jgi:pilus assembly protein CpaB